MLQDDKIEPKARDNKNGQLIMKIMDVGKNISLYASLRTRTSSLLEVTIFIKK